MRPATTLTIALLLFLLLGAAVVAFFVQPNGANSCPGRAQGVACDSPTTSP